MKNIENKKINLTIEQYDEKTKSLVGMDFQTNYFDLFYECCKRPMQKGGGYTWEAIEKINRVKEICKKAQNNVGEIVEVEDADFNFIKERVLSNTWSTFDSSLLDLKNYLEKI
jgi:hypothetical protein